MRDRSEAETLRQTLLTQRGGTKTLLLFRLYNDESGINSLPILLLELLPSFFSHSRFIRHISSNKPLSVPQQVVSPPVGTAQVGTPQVGTAQVGFAKINF